MPRERLLKVLATLVLLLGAATDVGAQPHGSAVVRVVVVDTMDNPLMNAQVTVLSGLRTVLATGLTDSTGVRSVVVPSAAELQLVVRRVGSRRSSQFFTAAAGVETLRVVLTPVITTLSTVRVVARPDPKRVSYHVDADDIAASTRPIIDALDVLTKLRPDMLRPRAATPIDPCQPRHVWVNGQRIVLAPADEEAQLHFSEEINYVDCTGTIGDRPNMSSSVFVVLKKGVAFEPGIGSSVRARTSQVVARADTDSDAASKVPHQP